MDDLEQMRPRLFAIAYNMLGSVMEAEDVVQDAWLRFHALDHTQIRSPEAMLKTIVTRLCLDTLKSAQVRREQYIGPWLPEPVITDSAWTLPHPEQRISREETVSIAFLSLMEQLSPAERAVFLLREVFDYEYSEIAAMLERSETACRKLFSRARQHLAAHRPQIESAPQYIPLAHRFMQAVYNGDMNQILHMLTDSVVVTSDGGGKVVAARHPVVGPEAVAAFFLGIARQAQKQGIQLQVDWVEINGGPGCIIRTQNGIDSVFTFVMYGNQIDAVHAIRNPDKLRHLNLPR